MVSVHEDVYTLVQNVTIKQHNRKVFNNMCHQFIKVLYTLVLNVTIEQHKKIFKNMWCPFMKVFILLY